MDLCIQTDKKISQDKNCYCLYTCTKCPCIIMIKRLKVYYSIQGSMVHQLPLATKFRLKFGDKPVSMVPLMSTSISQLHSERHVFIITTKTSKHSGALKCRGCPGKWSHPPVVLILRQYVNIICCLEELFLCHVLNTQFLVNALRTCK